MEVAVEEEEYQQTPTSTNNPTEAAEEDQTPTSGTTAEEQKAAKTTSGTKAATDNVVRQGNPIKTRGKKTSTSFIATPADTTLPRRMAMPVHENDPHSKRAPRRGTHSGRSLNESAAQNAPGWHGIRKRLDPRPTITQGELGHGTEQTVETATTVEKMTVRGNENGRE